MTRFADIEHTLWVAAPIATVRTHFADLQHHIQAQVHSQRRYTLLARHTRGSRFVQEVRLRGGVQHDLIERRIDTDGSIHDRTVDGPNQGATQSIVFHPHIEGGERGTRVGVTLRVPLPSWAGVLLRPLRVAQVRKELSQAMEESRLDLETRGYPRAMTTEAALAA